MTETNVIAYKSQDPDQQSRNVLFLPQKGMGWIETPHTQRPEFEFEFTQESLNLGTHRKTEKASVSPSLSSEPEGRERDRRNRGCYFIRIHGAGLSNWGSTIESHNVLHYWLNRDEDLRESYKKDRVRELESSKNQEEVIAILEKEGFFRQVESFRQHVLDRNDYAGETDHPDAKLDSLKAAARFLINYEPPYSDIEADLEGNVEMEWLLSSVSVKPDSDHEFWGNGSGYMAIRFVSSKAIEFAMLSGPWAENRERLKVSGIFSHSKMHSIIEMFRDRVVLYD